MHLYWQRFAPEQSVHHQYHEFWSIARDTHEPDVFARSENECYGQWSTFLGPARACASPENDGFLIGKLFIGSLDHATNQQWLKDKRITHILSRLEAKQTDGQWSEEYSVAWNNRRSSICCKRMLSDRERYGMRLHQLDKNQKPRFMEWLH